MKRNITLVIVLLLIVGAIVYLESQKVRPAPIEEEEEEIVVEVNETVEQPYNPKDDLYVKAPELRAISGYLNTEDGLTIESLRGKVVLIDFWTYTCVNCIRTLPYLTSWDEKYRDDGLVIIGVHTPEFAFEKKTENVQGAIDEYNIKYPVVQDNDYGTWRAYENRFWPRKYLIDSEGYIRYDHIGEGAYQETEEMIQTLLEELGEEIDEEIEEEEARIRLPITPELYAGAKFISAHKQALGNGPYAIGSKTYEIPDEIPFSRIVLSGKWYGADDGLTSLENPAVILDFRAKEVNIVTKPQRKLEVNVSMNGAWLTPDQAGDDVTFDGERSYVEMELPRLYNVYRGNYTRAYLMLNFPKGLEFNAFTFG